MADSSDILECLTGYIGMMGCGNEVPGSGLYINSLPGITMEMVDKIADAEQVTYVGVWVEVEKRGLLMFRTAFMAELNKCYQINERTTVSCLACEYKDLLSTSLWYLLGRELMTERIYSDRINRYTTIDREQAIELRDHYQVTFENELAAAVQGIDVEHSDCIANEEDCPQQNGAIHYRESSM
jgi:hypothetical protein